MKHWADIAERAKELSEEAEALRRVASDRERLIRALKPFSDAFRALPESMKTEALGTLEVSHGVVSFKDWRGHRESPPILMVGDLVIRVSDLAIAALTHELHTRPAEPPSGA